jgi:hypothetical protein
MQFEDGFFFFEIRDKFFSHEKDVIGWKKNWISNLM